VRRLWPNSGSAVSPPPGPRPALAHASLLSLWAQSYLLHLELGLLDRRLLLLVPCDVLLWLQGCQLPARQAAPRHDVQEQHAEKLAPLGLAGGFLSSSSRRSERELTVSSFHVFRGLKASFSRST